MAIKKIEIRDNTDNLYYPHTDVSVVRYDENNTVKYKLDSVDAQLNENTQNINIISNKFSTSAITFINGFKVVSDIYENKITKVGNIVHLSAIIVNESEKTYERICWIPADFRPSKTHILIAKTENGIVQVNVNNMEIIIPSTIQAGKWVSLEFTWTI